MSDTQPKVWQGADSLTDLTVDVDGLTVLPGNPRQGDVGAISESLERFGQLKPIVVDGAGVIIAGNHTYKAAVAIGWTHIAAITPNDLSPQELAAFALADNRLSDLAEYDAPALFAGLSDLDDLTGTGYDAEDIDDVLAVLEEFNYGDTATKSILTRQERADNRELREQAGNVVRSIVLILDAAQHAWAVDHLRTVEGTATNSEAIMELIARYSGEPVPGS